MKPMRIQSLTVFDGIKTVQNKDRYAVCGRVDVYSRRSVIKCPLDHMLTL